MMVPGISAEGKEATFESTQTYSVVHGYTVKELVTLMDSGGGNAHQHQLLSSAPKSHRAEQELLQDVQCAMYMRCRQEGITGSSWSGPESLELDDELEYGIHPNLLPSRWAMMETTLSKLFPIDPLNCTQ